MTQRALQGVIQVRDLSEEKAVINVAKMKRQLTEYKELEGEAQNKLVDFRHWREQNENALFSAMAQHHVRASELNDYQYEINRASQHENELLSNIEDIKIKCKEALAQLEVAQKTLCSAKVACQKLKQKMTQFKKEENRQQELQEEDYLDEFSATLRIINKAIN
jgi:chromosome segregation ATPase